MVDKRFAYKQDHRSYAEQCNDLRGVKDASIYDAPFPRPSFAAQAKAPGAKVVPFSAGGVHTAPVQRPLLNIMPRGMTATRMKWLQRHRLFWRVFGVLLMHTIFFTGCWSTFTWRYFFIGCVIIWAQSSLGVFMTFHRMLSHRAFKVSRPLEYLLAWIGGMAMQESPITWCSNHRMHHKQTDTPLDPHSPYEGVWYGYFGWLLNNTDQGFFDRSNVADLTDQAFYRFMEATHYYQGLARLFITAWFGWAPVVWTMAFPLLASWNISWFGNMACHMWGKRPYDTGDLSTNNAWWNFFCFGEGWHNNHHAFPFSARVGLEWWQHDSTYAVIWLLEKLGLAWDVRVPSARDVARRGFGSAAKPTSVDIQASCQQ